MGNYFPKTAFCETECSIEIEDDTIHLDNNLKYFGVIIDSELKLKK